MLSVHRNDCERAAAFPQNGGACHCGFNTGRSAGEGAALARERRQKQSALHTEESIALIRKYAAKGQVCPLGGVWNASMWRMQGRDHLKKSLTAEKEKGTTRKGQFPLFCFQHLLGAGQQHLSVPDGQQTDAADQLFCFSVVHFTVWVGDSIRRDSQRPRMDRGVIGRWCMTAV